jgi:hypothetical protein
MNRKQIIEIATQVYGECEWHESALLHLELFAKLVAAKEREKFCALLRKFHDSISLVSDSNQIRK